MIGKRLTRLSTSCNRVLAVAGGHRPGVPPGCAPGGGRLPEEDLYAALEEARPWRWSSSDRQWAAVSRFRFAHAFFRQTLYEEMFVPRRIRLHQQVARVLEEVHARRLE